MAKSKLLTLTQKYELAMEYIKNTDESEMDFFIGWLKRNKNLTDDQIKQFTVTPF